MRICVLGASRGIGLALCRLLLEQGHDVWAASRSPTAPMKNCHWSAVDVRKDASILAWKEDMKRSTWEPDIVVLNAAVQWDDMHRINVTAAPLPPQGERLGEAGYDHERGRDVLRTNLDGPLRCIALFLPLFLSRKSGTFVAVGSTTALRPSLLSASYAASKAGLAMAMRSLRLRHRKDNMRFATAYFGPIATDMWEGRKHWLVASPEQAAAALARFLFSEKTTLYYPRLSTWLLRLSMWLPDTAFVKVAQRLLHRS